ncbi:MAG: oligosaccharide flippase family protein, partial [Owenweeksia sp.]
MQKKFISNLLLLLFLNFLVKPAWVFGIDLTVQNRVGAEEYGLYFALFNFSMIFNILLDLGLTHYNNQAVARNRTEVVRNFSNLTSLKFLLGLLYFGITVIAGFMIGYESTAFLLLLILSFNQFLASLILFFRSNLSGMQFFRADSILSVIDKTLMIVLCGVLLFGLDEVMEFNVVYYALAQSLSYILASIIAFVLVWKKVRIFTWRINLRSYGQGLKKSVPYALLILLMSLYTRVDGIMLERLVGSYENGIYAASFRLLDMVNQLGYLFAVLLLPMFSNMLGNGEKVGNLTRLSFNLIFTVLLGVSLVAYFRAGGIMDYLYLADDPSLAPVF